MRVLFAPDALRELRDHLTYVRERNPEAARNQRRVLFAAIDQLETLPHIGRPGRVPGTRELVITGTPYLAVYEVTVRAVRVLHIHHGRQNWAGDTGVE